MNTKNFLRVMAFALIATACSNEVEIETNRPTNNGSTTTIKAYQPEKETTRVGYDKNGVAYWQANDAIGVWSVDENKFKEFSLASGAGEAEATFTGSLSGEMGTVAVYPFNENHSLSNRDLTYFLPSSYKYTSVDSTYFPTGKDGNSYGVPLYGVLDSQDKTVKFKYLGGVLALKIDKLPMESGTIVITSDVGIAGSSTINLNQKKPAISADDLDVYSVTFKYSGAKVGQAGVFYLPMAPGTYSLTVKIKCKSGIYDYAFSKDLSDVTVDRAGLRAVKVNTNYTIKIDGHEFVDLGLPSGLLWAKTNIGADSEYDAGDYFAWGETKTKDNYSWSTYAYGSSESSLTKYNSTDKKTELDPEDDAAYMNWGTYCRMPTLEEFKELINTENCTNEYNFISSGIRGYTLTSTKNGASMFFLITNKKTGEEVYTTFQELGWTKTAGDCMGNATGSGNSLRSGYIKRYYGLNVRPVAEPYGK